MALADWDRLIAVDLRGAFLFAKHSIPFMRGKGGAIVKISSVHAVGTEGDEKHLERVPSAERLGALSRDWKNVVTLAVILEPIYWPGIAGSQRLAGGVGEEEGGNRLEAFRAKVLGLVRSLDPGFCRNVHECLRTDAASIDNNMHLYVLLYVLLADHAAGL